MEQQQRDPLWWKEHFYKVPAVKHGSKHEPAFPIDFEIVRSDVLQWTDVKANHNKYYSLELHKGKLNNKEVFRVFTHYGRTDDLHVKILVSKKRERIKPL
eukprot:TRINITY_DN8167_c0_g1_i1.p1 TRINITY_DN8167_c0_g1~~TRINITY_DN8167_c0_g1_i1.p1  ORF type:complete len:100 (+),score=16.39 TRINITY_DN8167_c0_g1_i1:36-335(+)